MTPEQEAGGGGMTAQERAELARARSNAQTLAAQNERLVRTLKDAREQITTLRAEVERLGQPPSPYATLTRCHADGTVDVLNHGRRMNVAVSPEVERSALAIGADVRLNEAMNVVSVHLPEDTGEVVMVTEVVDPERVLVRVRQDEERVVRLAGGLVGRLRPGDSVRIDTKAGIAHEPIDKAEVADLLLEEVPDVSYDDIGGLSSQIEAIRDAVELPWLHPELYAEHGLKPPKGVLLYGPPGNGKTMIAKAVAASLARRVAQDRGRDVPTAYFLNIKGPELLNKYVGETERHIRLIFERARSKAGDGMPVVVFFDEMDSLFRTRGSGVSSDVETTIVPQLLAEIDGVEGLENVIVIGATNREDMIDPAILRPGRLDVKIRIDRPDADGAREIFARYLTPALPIAEEERERHGSAEAAVRAMIDAAVERMYAPTPENRFIEITYASGRHEVLHLGDFASGAMIQNVVDRAKKRAIKELIASGRRGLRTEHLLAGVAAELLENEDLPNTSDPASWARVSGRRGEKVVALRSLVDRSAGEPAVD